MKTEIDNYLDNCPFFDYSNEKDVHNYAGTFLLWLLKNFFNLLQNSLIQKAKMDHKQLIENPELQNIALYYEEVRKILNYLERKYIVNKMRSKAGPDFPCFFITESEKNMGKSSINYRKPAHI